jgi:rhodanese-related sulfurtransferase
VTPRNAKITFLSVFLLLGAVVAVLPAGGNTAPGEVSPAEAETFAVNEDDFEGRRLAWSYFQALAGREDVMIIDARSGFLPAGDPPGLTNVRPIPLEIFLPNFVARKVHQDKTLLIFEESGHELRRLQFHLQKHGYDFSKFL